jgi:hypothetical protein
MQKLKLKEQIQKIKQVKKGGVPPFSGLKIGARIYKVIDFKKNRVKSKGGFKWQTDRREILIKQTNAADFSYGQIEPSEFNISLQDLLNKAVFGYSEIKFLQNDEGNESQKSSS